MSMRTIVIGLGNPILRDDSVGLRVVKQLRTHLDHDENVVIEEDYWGGLRLMEHMVGYDRAIIIDAICTDQEPPGTIMQLNAGGIPTQRSASAHDVNLPTALELGRQAGAHLPCDEQILLIGIEAEDVLTFDENLSPAVEQAVPDAVEFVLDALSKENGQL
ncbi:MAG: hydrogenase maturation protease [Anaerolineales bacterium]